MAQIDRASVTEDNYTLVQLNQQFRKSFSCKWVNDARLYLPWASWLTVGKIIYLFIYENPISKLDRFIHLYYFLDFRVSYSKSPVILPYSNGRTLLLALSISIIPTFFSLQFTIMYPFYLVWVTLNQQSFHYIYIYIK